MSEKRYSETLELECNKREFLAWLPLAHARHYKETPEGGEFWIGLFQFIFKHAEGNSKYIFETREDIAGHSKIREEFFILLRNSGLMQGGAVKPKGKRGPQGETKRKLEALRELRSKAITNGYPIPAKKLAMTDIEIDRKTWTKYDKELYDNWDVRTYK